MPPEYIVSIFASLIISITVHEYAHAKLADIAGDPTPRIFGRVTLNPIAHFDPVGAMMIILSTLSGFGFGWGRPVPMDPSKMKNPKWDHFWAVFGAPLTNLFQAIVVAIILKTLTMSPGLAHQIPNGILEFLIIHFTINITLFLFNLIPLGPLDGMWVLGTFLPDRYRIQWTRWNLRIGSLFLLGALLLPIFGGSSLVSVILYPLSRRLSELLLG